MGEAALAGHEAAIGDLARMYARLGEIMPPEKEGRGRSAKRGQRSAPKPRRIESLGREYYGYLSSCPQPFESGYLPQAAEDAPAYVTAAVTPAMRASAVNHLGDRYFYGEGIPENKMAAVACYRRAAETTLARGEPVAGGIIWAQYSLGYCLLEGVGTRSAPREAVKWLSRAARYHGEAAYGLAQCYEQGIGVDGEDTREALKFYRKALKLGCTAAEEKIPQLERKLREEE